MSVAPPPMPPDPSTDPALIRVKGQTLHQLGPLRYYAVPGEHYLLVRYEGRAETVGVTDAWLQHLESTLVDRDLSMILWDSRPADGLPPDVRDRIWAWIEEARVLKRSAIIVNSEMLRLSANLTDLGGVLQLRAFASFQEADDWLGRAPR